MADNPSRPDKPQPPPQPPEHLKPTPEFQQRLDDFRAQKEAKQDAGQVVDHRAAKAENQEKNAAAREETAERNDPAPPSRSAERDGTDSRQRAADGAAPQRASDVSRTKEDTAPNEAPGLKPTPEFQQKLDDFRAHKEAKQDAGQVVDHRAAKAENQERMAEGGPAQQQRPADFAKQQAAPDSAATRQTSPQETAAAHDGTAAARTSVPTDSRTTRQDEPRGSAGDNDRNPPGPPGEYTGPERRQYAAQHLDPAHDLRRQDEDRDVPRAATDDPPRPGDRGFDPGVHHGELRSEFRPGTHDPGGLFQEKERHIADRLAEDGASVYPRVRIESENSKNPDSMVRTSPDDPGTITEFKTLQSANSGAVRFNIIEAGGQVNQYGGGDVVIDGRGVKLTDEDARRGYARAVGQAKQMDLPMPQRVMIILGDGSIKVFPEE